MRAFRRLFSSLTGRLAQLGRILRQRSEVRSAQAELSRRFEVSIRDREAQTFAVRRQHARDSLRLKVLVLHARFLRHEERLVEMRRILRSQPGFEARNIKRIERYFSNVYANKKKIRSEIKRLVDFPEAVVIRDGVPREIRLRRRGWMSYPKFVRAVELGKYPIYTIRRILSNGAEKKVPVLVPWASVVEEMMGFSRDQVKYLESREAAA